MLNADNGIRIHNPDRDEIVDMFMNKLCCIYGLTGSGKSFGAKTIFDCLAEVIPRFLIYSKTENVNGDYGKIAPSPCVSSMFSVDKLKMDLEHQDGIMNIWKVSNTEEKLAALAKYLCDKKSKRRMDNIINELNEKTHSAEENLKKQIKVAKNRVYKEFIWENFDKKPLNEDQKLLIKFMDVNPCFCQIIDDFASELHDAINSKNKGKEFFESLAFNIRHYYMTSIFMLQDINCLNPKMRRNSQTTVFTSATEARKYFSTGGNAFSKEDKANAEMVIQKVFESEDFKILIYCRQGTYKNMWNYIIGDPNANPRLGCEPVQQLCEHIQKNSEGHTIDETNSFFSDLAD